MNRQVLIDEIKQVTVQYDAEVTRTNKAWPKAVRDRVTQLLADGMNARKISEATGISYGTVLKWRTKKGAPRGRHKSAFKELAVSGSAKVNAAATSQKDSHTEDDNSPLTIITVRTHDGFAIDVVGVSEAVKLLTALRQLPGGYGCF